MDLNINVQRGQVRENVEMIEKAVSACIKLGYKEIAFAVHIDSSQINNIPQPFVPLLNQQLASFIKIYTRLTVAIEDTIVYHKLTQSPTHKHYDLLAIEPLNEKMINQVCGGTFPCEIITFNLADRISTPLKKANFSVALDRGIMVEINYSKAFASPTDRKHIFANGQLLVQKTKGKNILISSGTSNCMFIRGPMCIANLGLLFGLRENQSRDAVFLNGLKAKKHSDVRKEPAKSAISIDLKVASNEKWLIQELTSEEASDEPQAKKSKLN